ncbi:related to Serine palmitoyltransferase 1 [Saccharomycodes ludwigii]|uniref:serine C-palmitoyltransferase n=1 Tax=Saccharomycodes ludwigii TaxID=36035 RepID=A0A376B4L8_9ASCO|nr:hypothetical protein SCDLUD_004851 [Saccharomycodes ludwigii]KAH3899408.1 hypothetical protein SCDLUD_004851 [Saccharomycodes ludwigii]SSD59613.1 related to Serine palmitoyltransferase 1 [Saccharomycodes ludwigii]
MSTPPQHSHTHAPVFNFELLHSIVLSFADRLFEESNKIPVFKYIVQYIRKSHQDDPYRTMIELCLIIYGIIYFLAKPKKTRAHNANNLYLSNKETNLLIEEWEPEPLAVPISEDVDKSGAAWRLKSIPKIVKYYNSKPNYVDLQVNGAENTYTNVLNMSSFNFLQLNTHPEVMDAITETIKNYGVGSCGPAGFYGNEDVHYNLEYDLAKFFGTENAVLYGQDFCVAPSVLSTFAKRGDFIVADNQVSVSIQNALSLSRSTVYYYQHNDMDSLESLLIKINEDEKHEPIIHRKFIVTEAVFHNSGDLCPLDKIAELKEKYKFRLFLDETLSLGVLGAHGKGITEHFGFEKTGSVVDIVVGSMANVFGLSGGFVLGDDVMSYFQRIGSNAYCFSASLPPYGAKGCSAILDVLKRDNSTVLNLQKNSRKLHDLFFSTTSILNYFQITSSEYSPIVHLSLTPDFRYSKFGSTLEDIYAKLLKQQETCKQDIEIEEFNKEEFFLQSIANKVLERGNILIARNPHALKHESLPISPSLLVCCSSSMSDEEIVKSFNVIKEVIMEVV